MDELIKQEESSLQAQNILINDENTTTLQKGEMVTSHIKDDDIIILSSGEVIDVMAESKALNDLSLLSDSPISIKKPLTSSTPIITTIAQKYYFRVFFLNNIIRFTCFADTI